MEKDSYVRAFRQRVLRSLTDASVISSKISKSLDKDTVGWVYGLYKDVSGKLETLEYENILLKKKVAKYEKIIHNLTCHAKKGGKNED